MKRLYLSQTDKKIAGICGGVAEYLEVDSTVVRLVSVILAVVTGFFPLLIGYLIAWLIIPKEPPTQA
jgi:phage shock protein C